MRRSRRYGDLGPSVTVKGPGTGDSTRSSPVATETMGCSANEELLEVPGLSSPVVCGAPSKEDSLEGKGKFCSKSSIPVKRHRWPPLEDGNTGSQMTEVDGSRATRTSPLEAPEGGVEPPERTGDRASTLSPAGNPSKERPLEHCEPQRDESLCNAICSFGVDVLE